MYHSLPENFENEFSIFPTKVSSEQVSFSLFCLLDERNGSFCVTCIKELKRSASSCMALKANEPSSETSSTVPSSLV